MSKANGKATAPVVRATVRVNGVDRDAEMFRSGGPALREMIAAGGVLAALAAAEKAVRDAKPRNIERAAAAAKAKAEKAAAPPKPKADGRPPGFSDAEWAGVLKYREARAAQKAAKAAASNPPPVVPAAPSPVPSDSEARESVLAGVGSATSSDLAEFGDLFVGNGHMVAADTAAENGKAARKARRQASKRPDGPIIFLTAPALTI